MYSEPMQTSNMELLAKIVNGFQPFAIFTGNPILARRWKHFSNNHYYGLTQ